MARRPIPIKVKSKDLAQILQLLRGGIQQVRVVLRPLMLRQHADGFTAPQIAQSLPLTPKAIRQMAHRYNSSGLNGAVYDKLRLGADFARMMGHVAEQYLDTQTIHLVMDNLNAHCRKSLTDYFGEQEGRHIWDRFTVHYTPIHGSWLDRAETELSLFSRQCLGTRRIPELGKLQRETKAWNRKPNQDLTKINWRFTRQKARRSFKQKRPRRSG